MCTVGMDRCVRPYGCRLQLGIIYSSSFGKRRCHMVTEEIIFVLSHLPPQLHCSSLFEEGHLFCKNSPSLQEGVPVGGGRLFIIIPSPRTAF